MIDHQFRTNAPNVWAIGDCAQFREPLPGRRPLEQIWYTGKMHGETVAMNICGTERSYTPGLFFNSAKFFDIEYQIYGDVPAHPPEHIGSLYWEHSNHHHAIRINYEKSNLRVTGFNLMGVRFRHEVCDTWLREQRDLPYVIEHLKAANFDPEFFQSFEGEILRLYNQQFPDRPVKQKSRGKLIEMIFGSRRKHGAAVDLSAPSN